MNSGYFKNQQKWNEDFKEYFRKSILPRISTFGLWEIRKLFSFDVSNCITTKQAEGFNFLLKSLQGWQEVPVVVIMYAFHMPQRLYFTCLSCRKWFHTARQGLSHLTRAQVQKSKNIYCIQCSLKSKRNKK